MTEKKLKMPTKTWFKRFFRIYFRIIPIIPVPEIIDLITDLKRSQISIDEKIRVASVSLHETSLLLEELEEGLKDRAEKLASLHEEYERYSKLAQLEQDKAEPLLQQVQNVVDKNTYRERWINLILNICVGLGLFFLGYLLYPILKSIFGN